jgi:hypothetical protein
MSIVAKSLNKDNEMESLNDSPSFRLTSEILYGTDTQNSTKDAVTSFLEASLVSRFQSPESKPEPTIPATCGPQLSNACASYDRNTRSWKTSQGWLLADISAPSWETWQKAGLIVGGEFYQQPKWERRISEIGCGLLPTPSAQEPGWIVGGQVEVVDKDGNPPSHHNQRFYDKHTGRLVQKGITQIVQMWPTPTTRDWRSGHASDATHDRNSRPLSEVVVKAEKTMWPTPNASDGTGGPGNSGREGGLNLRTAVKQWRTPSASVIEPKSNVTKLTGRTPQDPQVGLADQVGGQLNADWVEWLMAWPIGWTSLEPLPQSAVNEWADKVRSGEWWANEPDIPRVAQGVPNRTHRLKAIGNGQVSPVVAMAWQLLTEG